MVITLSTESLVESTHEHLTTQEALSGIFGSISLASWIFLLVPQLIENYRQQSAKGISLLFLAVWFIGDIASLAGALWANLVPTVIALSVYFCIADLILVIQCLYYNSLEARRDVLGDGKVESPTGRFASEQTLTSGSAGGRTATSDDLEQQPLLSRRRSSDNLGLPGSHQRRRSSATGTSTTLLERRRGSMGHGDGDERTADGANDFAAILEGTSGSHAWLKNSVSILVICVAGTAGWFLAWRARVWSPTPVGGGDDGQDVVNTSLSAQVLGYVSALCYLGARIPQIIKNQRDRSCEGLSLLFFLLSLLGNATFGAGILFHSLSRTYILTNLPWLIGSLGTMFEDATIFVQFRRFRKTTTTTTTTVAASITGETETRNDHDNHDDNTNNEDGRDGMAME